MAQPVHSHDGTCSRCAAALGLRSGQRCRCVKRAASLPLAMRRIHFSDRAACARMAGSCSASSSTTRPTIDDLRHARQRSGRVRSTRLAHVADRCMVAAARNGWPREHGVEPRPGSCGDHPHTPVACMGACLRMRCLAKFPILQCPGTVLSAQPVCVVFWDSDAVGRRKLSVVSSR